jgi:hypothetical protein
MALAPQARIDALATWASDLNHPKWEKFPAHGKWTFPSIRCKRLMDFVEHNMPSHSQPPQSHPCHYPIQLLELDKRARNHVLTRTGTILVVEATLISLEPGRHKLLWPYPISQ